MLKYLQPRGRVLSFISRPMDFLCPGPHLFKRQDAKSCVLLESQIDADFFAFSSPKFGGVCTIEVFSDLQRVLNSTMRVAVADFLLLRIQRCMGAYCYVLYRVDSLLRSGSETSIASFWKHSLRANVHKRDGGTKHAVHCSLIP